MNYTSLFLIDHRFGTRLYNDIYYIHLFFVPVDIQCPMGKHLRLFNAQELKYLTW